MALRVFSKTILIIKKNHRTSNTVTHLHEEVIFFFDLLEIWVINASLHATSVLVPSRNNFLWRVISWMLNRERSLNCPFVWSMWAWETERGCCDSQLPENWLNLQGANCIWKTKDSAWCFLQLSLSIAFRTHQLSPAQLQSTASSLAEGSFKHAHFGNNSST